MRPQTFNDWCSAAAAATATAALVIATMAWLFPKQPAAFKMKQDRIYEDEKAIGRVTEFRLDPVLMGQYAMKVISKRKLTHGEIIGFRDIRCVVVDLQNEFEMPQPQAGSYAYNGVFCRIMSR